MKFKVQGNDFFRQNSKNVSICRVFDDLVERQTILQQLYNETGHKRQESIYQQIADRYWWDNLHMEVRLYIQSCKKCQYCDPSRFEKILHPT